MNTDVELWPFLGDFDPGEPPDDEFPPVESLAEYGARPNWADSEKIVPFDVARRAASVPAETRARQAARPSVSEAPAFSDEALARVFANQHVNQVRYVDTWGKWMIWDGSRWRADERNQAFAMIRDVCCEIASDPSASKQAKSLSSAKTVRSIEFLARADQRLAVTADQWDADSMLLNTPDGVVDLRTGKISPCDPALHMTKVAAATPGGDCPVFLAFLERIMDGDADLIAYLQRVLGYALTGDTSEHALFFGYGTGGNGKSVLIDTVAGILGDYSKTAPIETFAATGVERHPTELAGLMGARLVTAVETEEGRRWAESRIKTLTGGDKISARFVRQDFFEYQPQFKLLIAGNHKPGLRTVDEAMRRRFHMIPFAVSIPEGERDPGLKDKIKSEWPGILRWMVQGCLNWRKQGLAAPAAVRGATAAYLEAEDVLGAWLDDCCEIGPSHWELSVRLFSSWKAYAERSGEKPGNAKQLGQALEKRGFQEKRTPSARGRAGLRLKVDLSNE